MALASGDVVIGLDGVFKYGTAGSQGATTAANVEDVTLNLGTTEVDITRRGATWEASKVVLLSGELSFTIQKRVGDAFAAAVQAAYLAKSRIALYPTAHSAGEGLDADFYITGFNDGQPLKDKQTFEVTAKPSDEARAPQFH